MKILADARYLAPSLGGIRLYSECLLEALARIDGETEYAVAVHRDYPRRLALGPNFRFIPCDARPVSLKTVFALHRLIERERPDVVHAHYPITPALYRGALVATVHDLQPLRMPQWTGKRPWPVKMAYDAFYHWAYPDTFRRATRLICDSTATKNALAAIRPVYGRKAVVAALGVPPGIDSSAGDEATLEMLRRKHDLPASYAFYIGSTRPNKNLPGMLRAFARLREQPGGVDNPGFVLVVVRDRFFEDAQAEIERLGLRPCVRVLDEIGPEHKAALYRGARALFFATTHEGFGLPVLEAQAAGIPVLASTADALPETAGEGALLANPRDEADLAEKMGRILSDEDLRAALIEKGRENLKRFSWARCARITKATLEEAAREAH